VWSIFLRIAWPGWVFGLSLSIFSAPGAGLWLPGNPFLSLARSWGDSVGVQGLRSPVLLLLWSLNELPPLLARFHGPCLWIQGDSPTPRPKHNMKGILCITGSYMGKGDLGEGLHALRSLIAAPREMGESLGWENASWPAL